MTREELRAVLAALDFYGADRANSYREEYSIAREIRQDLAAELEESLDANSIEADELRRNDFAGPFRGRNHA